MRRILTPLLALLAGTAAIPAKYPPSYLAPGAVDLTRVLPPAPTAGDIRYETDRKVFRAMQAQVGTARWQAAIADVDFDTVAVMRDFACATGLTLSPAATPALFRLLDRAAETTQLVNDAAKKSWQRQRPFWIDQGQTCQKPEELGKSFDYPSGHTTKGWTIGLVLADLLPGRATPILARARAYGESRIVCRVHNMSAVEAGRLGAGATMTAVEQTAAYQRDFAAARTEIAHARPVADAATCQSEAALLTPSVLAGLKE